MHKLSVLFVLVAACVVSNPPPAAPGPAPAPTPIAGPPAGAPAPTGEDLGPVACSGDEVVAFADCSISGEVAIDAHGNCQLTLTNCNVAGSVTGIDAHGNAQVTIIGGSVTGPTAVDAHGNAQVVLDGTALRGDLDRHGNASVETR